MGGVGSRSKVIERFKLGRAVADVFYVMITEVIFVLSLLAFVISARGLLRALVDGSALNTSGFSRVAARIGQNYRVLAWSIMTAFLFYQMLISFLESFWTL